jgi:type VI secretion system protein
VKLPLLTRTTPLKAFVLVAAVGACTACAAKVSTRRFDVVAVPAANRDSPIPVDVVIIRDDALVPVVTAMSARQWFAGREQMVRDHPKGLEYRGWEFVPGQTAAIDPLPFSRKGKALFLFADYLSEGVHRLRVDPMKKFRLVLGAEGFTAEPLR